MKNMIAHWTFSAHQFLIPFALLVFAICSFVLVPLSFFRRTGVLAQTYLAAMALSVSNVSAQTFISPESVKSWSWVTVSRFNVICTVNIDNVLFDRAEMATYDYHVSYMWMVNASYPKASWGGSTPAPLGVNPAKESMIVGAQLHKNLLANQNGNLVADGARHAAVRSEEHVQPIELSVTVPGRAAPINILPDLGYPAPLPDGKPDEDARDQLFSAVFTGTPVLVKMVMESARYGTKTVRVASNLSPDKIAALRDCVQRGTDILHADKLDKEAK